MRNRTLLNIFAILIVAVLSTFATIASAQNEAQVRFVHAFVDAPDVDIYVNNEIATEGVTYGTATDYLTVPAGDIEVLVSPSGTFEPLFTQTITAGTEPVTLIVSSADGFTAYTDNVDALNLGQSRLTAIHAIDGGPAVDVVLVDGRPVIAGLEYDVAYGTLDVPTFNYALNVVPTGTELESAIFEEAFNAPLATGTSYMAIVYGTLNAPEVLLLATPVNPNAGDGFLQIVHDVEGAPAVDVYANDNLIVPGLAFSEGTVSFPIPADDYTIQVTAADTVDVLIGDEVSISSGSEATVSVISEDDSVVLNVVMEEMTVSASDTAVVASEVVVAPINEVVITTPEPQVVIAQPTAVAAQSGTDTATARVALDPGANLQLRQYPDAQALSLGLAPSGAVLQVNGRVGVPVQIEGLFSQELQTQIDEFVDPAEDLPETTDISAQDTWLNVTYTTADGGNISAWVLAQYLDVISADGEVQRLADLPTVPANNFGEATNTQVTPPPIPDDVVVGIVYNLDPGINLQIRRTPSTTGESLGLVQSGTVLEYIGFEISPDEIPGVEAAENAEWVYIRYTSPEGSQVTGWVSANYVEYQWRGEPIDFEEMEARVLLLFEDPSTRGELGLGAVAPARPTVDPLRDQIIATITLDPGANLQFRRSPNPSAESLGLIPSGTQLIVTARDESGEWLFVEFEGQTGWIASGFVRLTFNGAPFDLSDLFVEG